MLRLCVSAQYILQCADLPLPFFPRRKADASCVNSCRVLLKFSLCLQEVADLESASLCPRGNAIATEVRGLAISFLDNVQSDILFLQ